MTYETERNELRWQNVRKHAKREYMRQMSHYEETNSMKAIHEGGFSSKKSKNSLQRPDEPDLKSMKISFDQEAGLEGLEHLQLLRDAAMKRIIQSIKLMKQFIEKVSSLKVPQTTKFDAREHVRAKGRMSISVLHQVRNNQWGQHIQDAVDGVEPDEEITFPIDDEISLKQKCCLHIESLLAAIEIGVAL